MVLRASDPMPTVSQDSTPSLRLIDITKAYGPVSVLEQVGISVQPGEVVALMGANGAGKSTLAKIAAGVVEPDNGQIFVAGKEVWLNSPRIARQHGIVIVHQSTNGARCSRTLRCREPAKAVTLPRRPQATTRAGHAGSK